MNYIEWAEEYSQDARRVLSVIEKKKVLLNDKNLSSDARKSISDTITAYRRIYRELIKTAHLLRSRAGDSDEA